MADVLIRQFDVFANPERRRSSVEYLVILQSDLAFGTRGIVAAPLDRYSEQYRDQRLYPLVRVQDRAFVVVITEIATLPRKLLKNQVGNLSEHRDRIMLALDYLFTGV